MAKITTFIDNINGTQNLQRITDIGAITTNPITINAPTLSPNALYITGGDNGINVTGKNTGVYSRTLNADGVNFTGTTSTGTMAKYYLGSTGHGIVMYNGSTSTGDIFSLVRGSGTIFNIDAYGTIDSNSPIISNIINLNQYAPINGINDTLPDAGYTFYPAGVYGEGYYGGRFLSKYNGGSAILAESGTRTGITISVNSSASVNAINVIDEELFSVMNVGKDGDITAHSFIQKDGTGLNVLLDNGTTKLTTSILGTADLTTSQTSTNFTIVSSTGTDAVVPLGDGTNAGASLNNYTTAEQTKLGKYPSTATNGRILQGNGTNYVEIDTPTGTTNLNYIPTVGSGTVTSSTGDDAIILLADSTNAGLLSPSEKTKLAGIATGANVGVIPNDAIVGDTKTKITYDSKGLVISGANATTDDIGEGVTNLYWSNSKTISSVLNGISISGTSIISTDTILQALGKAQNQINALAGGVTYQGVWNASTNDPALTSSVGTKGYYYVVSVVGSTNLNGVTDWKLGDWAIYNGTSWQKVDNTDAVISVNGYAGIVAITTADVPESINKKYVTDANLAVINNTSNINTGDQGLQSVTDINSITTKTITAAGFKTPTGTGANIFLDDGNTTPLKFQSDIVVSLSSGKTLGKYTTGQTIPSAGKTFEQVMNDIAIEYLLPSITSFSISSQSTTVESGAVISGTKSFTFNVSQPSNVNSNSLIIYQQGSPLVSYVPVTSPSTWGIGTINTSGNGTSYSFYATAVNTQSTVFTSNTYTITSRYYQFYGNVTNIPTNSAEVRSFYSNLNFANINSWVTPTITTTKFSLSIPATKSLTSVITANFENITSSFVLSTFNVNDAGGNAISYRTYAYTSSVPLDLTITITVS